jgi:hypothetical protein
MQEVIEYRVQFSDPHESPQRIDSFLAVHQDQHAPLQSTQVAAASRHLGPASIGLAEYHSFIHFLIAA